VPPQPPTLLHTLALPASGIEAFAFTPDGTFVIAAAAPAEVRCRDLGDQTPRPMRIDHLLASPGTRPLLRARAGNARALAFGAEGRLVATAGPDGKVRAWRPPSPGRLERAMELDGLTTPLTALDPAAVYLAVADHSTLRLWEPASGAQCETAPPLRRVTALAFSPDGTRLTAAGIAGRTGVICLLDAWVGDELAAPVETGPDGATALAYSPDGTLLAAAVPGSGISLYDTTAWSLRAALPPGDAAPATARIAALAFTADARVPAAIPAGREVRVLSWRVPVRTAAVG
jgi:WD40 repeat protein